MSLDLHPIFRSNRDLDVALRTFMVRAAASGESVVELIPGKGSGKLRQRVLTFLNQPHVKKLYTRIELDPRNTGHILVHLR
jgi:dsDNA-specific endonuclease/ATPase MutS2